MVRNMVRNMVHNMMQTSLAKEGSRSAQFYFSCCAAVVSSCSFLACLAAASQLSTFLLASQFVMVALAKLVTIDRGSFCEWQPTAVGSSKV